MGLGSTITRAIISGAIQAAKDVAREEAKSNRRNHPAPKIDQAKSLATKRLLAEQLRFSLESFDLADQGVAELFGLELARLVVDTSYAELLAKQRDVEQRTVKPPHRR